MLHKIKKIKTLILTHKIISGIITVIVLVCVFFLFKGSGNDVTRYVTENVLKRNITTYVSETGQVEASNSINIEARASGIITYIGVKEGQEVKKGTLIASVDSRDEKVALENAQISLEQLVSPDSLSVLKSKNSLKISYDGGWNTTASFITDMTSTEEGLNNLFGVDGYFSYRNTSRLSSIGRDKISSAETSYYKAKKSLEDTVKTYKTLTRSSSNEDILNLIKKSYDTSKLFANAVKDSQSAFNYMTNYLEDENGTSAISTRANITSWVSDTNNYVNSLLSGINTIDENTQSLDETINPADELEIKSAKLSLQTKQNAYNDCFIYAPFDGIISSLTAKVGESSGSTVGTIITKQKVATISLNEVDIASIKLGQKAALTFDAIEGLKIEGEVVEIDSVGTVTSGVVTYDVKIAFEKDDDRVKPGMSVNASITTNEKIEVLTVSSNAIKTKNGKSYVEIFDTPIENGGKADGVVSALKPIRKEITLGISDDSITEIISGLKENDQIVTKTTTEKSSNSTSSSTNSSSKKSSSMNGIEGMGGGPAMGGMMR